MILLLLKKQSSYFSKSVKLNTLTSEQTQIQIKYNES